jgi:hypothetical protein
MASTLDGFLCKAATKIPEVTLVFWIIKIAATTLGETGGDSVTMTLDWGYLTGTLIFLPGLVLPASRPRAEPADAALGLRHAGRLRLRRCLRGSHSFVSETPRRGARRSGD